ncbi:hypothetical protein IAD21_03230 [Abditibacteriota bacterium]|nr:hypothetical protein IAD21_03230 [Abditibacteriota bacterium]
MFARSTILLWILVGIMAISTSLPPCQAAPSDSGDIVFPAEAGVLNVRDAQYGAKGDGVSDDTAAIQKALTEGLDKHRIVYLPKGTYLVSDTLQWRDPKQANNNSNGWGRFLQLQGQSRTQTIIKLKDGAPGFGDEEAPKAVIATGSSATDGTTKHYTAGEGNEAFENHLRNFSVDTGKNNAGAVGIDYQVSNCGAIRHVSVRGNGFCGIALTRRDNGPGLIKDVSVEGFRFGIRTYQELAHFTLEDVTLSGQGEAGLWMRDSIVGARHLTSHNSVPAIQMGGISLLALFDSRFTDGDGGAAIACSGTEPRLYVRNLQTVGYEGAVRRRGKLEASTLAEWCSDVPVGNSKGQLSLELPVRDTPDWYDADPKNWAIVPPSAGDDSERIQAALNSGKSMVFFPYGQYHISKTLIVPASVKRIQGAGTSLGVAGKLADGAPLLRFGGGKAGNMTIIDRFAVGAEGGLLAEHDDARTLVLLDLIPFNTNIYRSQKGAGPLFIEDVSSAGYSFAPGTQVWARQWNIEGSGSPKAINDGAMVWGLGLKHESAETIFENKNGGRAELWASFAYTFGADSKIPAYINTDASLAVQMAGLTYMPNGFFDLLVKDSIDGKTTEFHRDGAVPRGGAVTLPLYVSVSGNALPLAKPVVDNTPKNSANTPIKPVAASTMAAPTNTGKTYKGPEFFDGEEADKSTGNPLEVGGKPLWRFDQIWPEDPLQRANYKPMVWKGDSWHGEYDFGGQPMAKVEGGKITMGVRGSWGGGATQEGSKNAALVFIAPAKGIYSVTGTVRSGVWQGDKNASLLSALSADPKTGKVTKIRSFPTPSDTDVTLEGLEVSLEAGQELVLAPAVTQMYTAANFELRDLKVRTLAPPKVGDVLNINGRSYTVLKTEGKTITLQLQE